MVNSVALSHVNPLVFKSRRTTPAGQFCSVVLFLLCIVLAVVPIARLV